MVDNFCSRLGWSSLPGRQNLASACVAFALMALYLWILPVGHTVALRNLFLLLLAVLTLWSAWRHGVRIRFPLAYPWLAYAAVALFSLYYAIDPVFSFGEIKKEIGYGVLTIILAATWVRNFNVLDKLVGALIVGNIFLVSTAIFKVVLIDPFWRHEFRDIKYILYGGPGTFLYNGVGDFSTYLITTIPLIAAFALARPTTKQWHRNVLLVLLVLNVLVLYLTGNRMGLVILGAQVLCALAFLFYKQTTTAMAWKTLLAAATVTVLAGFIALKMFQSHPVTDDNLRMKIWPIALKDIYDNPLTGGGFGRTVMAIRNPEFYQKYGLEHAHNMILDKGVQMGLPGIAAFLLLWGATLRALWPTALRDHHRLRAYALAALMMSVSVFLKNMTDDFFVSHNAFLYWTLVGAVIGALDGTRAAVETRTV